MRKRDGKPTKLRCFVLSEEIDNESAGDVIQWIYDINQIDAENDFDLKDYKPKPMELIINSFGGSVYDTFAIINAITTSKTPIITTNIGSSFSGALYILAAGHIRLAAPLSSFMYHELSTDLYYTYKDKISEEMTEMKRIQDMLEEFLVSRTKVNRKMLEKYNKSRSEWYFGVEDAIKFKIIDGVYTSVK
jgi:ATP-dependent Clp protease protease subunit